MIDIGHFCLVAAWILSVYGLVVGIIGARRQNQAIVRSCANAVLLQGLFAVGSLFSLAALFAAHDYRYTYVWQTSNNEMPWYYLISAVWGGMDGSMLLWAALMAVFGALVMLRLSAVPRELAAWLPPVLSGATGFFLFVVTFLTNPFRLIPGNNIPTDGNGLNPLLQNPSMLIHPPMLYLGFTGFVVPFAFCMAALLSGKLDDHWILLTRRWTLVAWSFLTCGIILGGHWAYIELGWGGFWAWDPVENASFLPWLTGTAFLHSVMVQERRGMLKVWNASLSLLTYSLTVFGTFLTRSGVVQSVHAFAETEIGWVFLLYIGILIAITSVLIWYRWSELRPDNKLESYFSREAAFLFNNLVLLSICFATLWGVMFPVFSEYFAGEKSVVGPPFFNRVNVPLFLALIFLMGVGPLISWRRSNRQALLQTFWKPMLAGSILTALFLWLDPSRMSAAIAFGIVLFAVMAIESEFRRALRVRRQLTPETIAMGIVGLVRSKPRRYGGFLVHLGVAVMTVAITASMAYKIEKDLVLKIGERAEVGNFVLELDSLKEVDHGNYAALVSYVKVYDRSGKELLGTLTPERRVYVKSQESTTEVDIRTTVREDLYIALAGSDMSGIDKNQPIDPSAVPAIFKIFINPLQVWLWVGSLVVLLGTLSVLGTNVLASVRVQADSRATAKVGV